MKLILKVPLLMLVLAQTLTLSTGLDILIENSNQLQIGPNSTQTKNPSFGHSMKPHFLLDPNFIQLNHGSYGSYPKIVRNSLHHFQNRAESNPDLWIRRDAQKELIKIRNILGKYMNVTDSKDLVLVPNVTTGLNAVLRSICFRPGDVILYFSTTFIGLKSILKFIYDTNGGQVSLLEFPLNYPISNENLLRNFEMFLAQHSGVRIRLAVVDHISSKPGVLMPLESLVKLLQNRNIPVLVDGAHAIGQVHIDIGSLKPDYYVTDCHKSLYTPRGSAVLYIDKNSQPQIHPAVISFHYQIPSNIQEEFYFVGTTDYTNYMTIPTALQFRHQLGETNIRRYNHNLAIEGGKLMAQLFRTSILQEPNQIGSMIDVELPLTNHNNPILSEDFWVDILLTQYKVFAIPHKYNGKWWVRLSAQIYNDLKDFKVAGDVFKEICDNINLNQKFTQLSG